MTEFLRIEGEIMQPDFVIRFENLRADFGAVVNTLGLPVIVSELPHRNQSAAPDLFASTLADEAARRIVATRFGPDFEFFGYEP